MLKIRSTDCSTGAASVPERNLSHTGDTANPADSRTTVPGMTLTMTSLPVVSNKSSKVVPSDDTWNERLAAVQAAGMEIRTGGAALQSIAPDSDVRFTIVA